MAEGRMVADELARYWDKFVETPIAKQFQKDLPGFRKWLEDIGPRLMLARAREAAAKGNPVAKDYVVDYAMGMLRRGGERVLVNMFAAWLVENKLVSQYYLIKNKLVAGGESIATWLRALRGLDKA